MNIHIKRLELGKQKNKKHIQNCYNILLSENSFIYKNPSICDFEQLNKRKCKKARREKKTFLDNFKH